MIIDNWQLQAVTQDARMLEFPLDVHTLRFECADVRQRSRICVSLRCLEPQGAELQRRRTERTSEQQAALALHGKAIEKLKAIGEYVNEGINSPNLLVGEVNFDGCKQPVDNTVMSALRTLPGIKSLVFGANELAPKGRQFLPRVRSHASGIVTVGLIAKLMKNVGT